MHIETFSSGLASSLIAAEPCLIPAYRRGNQAGTTESNIWTSQCWCVQSRVCVCRGGFEISSTPSLLTWRRGCVCLASVGQWLLGSSWTPPDPKSPPPPLQPFTHTHTHSSLSASLFLPPRPTPSSASQTCIVSDSLMWNCFSFKFPPGSAGRRKTLHLIMVCYCCSFIRVLGFWALDFSARSWGHTWLFFPLLLLQPLLSLPSLILHELTLCCAHGNPAKKFITTLLYDYAMH